MGGWCNENSFTSKKSPATSLKIWNRKNVDFSKGRMRNNNVQPSYISISFREPSSQKTVYRNISKYKMISIICRSILFLVRCRFPTTKSKVSSSLKKLKNILQHSWYFFEYEYYIIKRGEIIIYPSVGKYCFPNRDSSRCFSARARYERGLK